MLICINILIQVPGAFRWLGSPAWRCDGWWLPCVFLWSVGVVGSRLQVPSYGGCDGCLGPWTAHGDALDAGPMQITTGG